MLYVVTESNSTEFSFHVGDNMKFEKDDVIEIQADGHELQYILDSFKNIPVCNKPVIVWEGEIAKFIAKNLRW